MKSNCTVIREFEVPGGTYLPGRELGLGAVLLEKWVQMGFVELIVHEKKPKRKPRKRTVKMKTVVTT